MMLSNVDLLKVIESGELVIDPYDKRLIRPAGVAFHLGETILRPKPGKVVDVKTKVIPDYDKIIIKDSAPYELQPGEFVLGHTYEKVTVGSSLGFFIEGRSTLARVGLTIVQTAMLVYPGHRARAITLELANHGPNPIRLYPLMKIARAAVIELKTPCDEDYDDSGKYKDQCSVGKPIFDNEFL